MAFNVLRFVRIIHSIFIPTAAIFSITTLLTWTFILYHPNSGPGNIQRLGWQAWDAVTTSTSTTDGGVKGSESSSPPGVPAGDSVDWWNVTSEQKQPDPSTLPLDVWSPLLPHDTGRM